MSCGGTGLLTVSTVLIQRVITEVCAYNAGNTEFHQVPHHNDSEQKMSLSRHSESHSTNAKEPQSQSFHSFWQLTPSKSSSFARTTLKRSMPALGAARHCMAAGDEMKKLPTSPSIRFRKSVLPPTLAISCSTMRLRSMAIHC